MAALRKALLDTMKDPGLIADAKKINVVFKPMSGETVAKKFADIYSAPRSIVEKTYTAVTKTD